MAGVVFSVSEEELNKIKKRLEDISGKQNLVLKAAVNEAAKKIRGKVAKEASKRYATSERKAYLPEMAIKNATSGNITAEITAKSKRNANLFDFNISNRNVLKGKDRPKYLKGKVLRSSKMKNLSEDGFKAFVIKFRYKKGGAGGSAGEEGETYKVVRRISKKKRSVKKLIAPSIAQMLNTAAGTPEMEEEAKKILKECLEKHMQKVLEGK